MLSDACPSCHGARGRLVSELIDGENRETRWERCEHCDDYAAELAADERLDAERQDAALAELDHGQAHDGY